MFRSLSFWLRYVIAPNTVLLIILPSLLCFSPPFHPQSPSLFLSLSAYVYVCVCVRTSWICLRGEEGGIKSVERTWQLLFSLSLHCFGPPQILFHGAKHPLPGISTAPISRRRFKPLSWHPDWAWREKACDAHQHRQKHKHTYYLCSERDRRPAVCAVLTHTILVSQAVLAAFSHLWHETRGHTWTCKRVRSNVMFTHSPIKSLKQLLPHQTHSTNHSVK